MKKIQLFLVMLLVSCLTAAAQGLTVTGKITYADDGSPVIGATIKVKGTHTATLSDVNGYYKITIPANTAEKVLVVTFTGLTPKEVQVSQSGTYDVEMSADAMAIEDVVVTGYGNYTKKDYTGAAATVSTARTKDIPAVSVQSRMAGAIPGLQITSTSGQPGAVESVRIRGMGSINAGNEPLYVVDGVPMQTGNGGTFSYSQAGNSILASLNPNDIENLTVIKDAAAASLYGSRAANGVIIITTKKGFAGKTKFNVKASYGLTDMAANWRPTLDGDATVELFTHALFNYGKYDKGWSDDVSNKYAADKIDGYYKKPWSGWTDWRKEILKVGKAQNYEFSAQGGNEKTRFFSSLAYTDMQGITMNSDYKRITGRLNVDHKSGNFTFAGSAMYSNVEQDVNSEGTLFTSPMMGIAIALSPSDYPYNEDGSINITSGFGFLKSPLSNPLQAYKYNYDKSTMNRVNASVSGAYEFFKGLSLKEVLSFDYINSNNRVWWDPRTKEGQTAKGVYQRYMVNRSTLISQTQLTYNKIVADKHNISALASFEVESYNYDRVHSTGTQYPNPLLPEIDNAGTTSGGSVKQGYGMVSVVARADYNYDNRYYIGASYRRDGSSRLAPDVRWGDFWSVSGSWRLSQENFFKNGGISSVLTDAKVRLSYGVNGTQPSDYYGWMGLYGYGYNYNGFPGSAQENIISKASPLSWEKNHAANIGIDFSFIERINVSVDLYNRDTKDLILAQPLSLTTGFASTLKNVGSMRNRGIEVDIKGVVLQNEDFNWVVGINMSHNRNTLLSLNDGQSEIQNGRWVHRIGNPYYSFNLFEYAGVDPATGSEQYYTNKTDKEGNIIDRTVTTDVTKVNKAIVGSWEPKLQGGITSNFSWKWIDFNFTLSYSLGGQCVDNLAANYANGYGWAQSGIAIPSYNDIDKMWKKPGDIAELPRYQLGGSGNEYTSTRYLMSTDHLRLKNMTIGFSAPKQWISKLGVERIRIYASANNLFTIKDPGLYVDPETPIGGAVSFETPQLRTISFGLEIGF